VKGAYLKTAVVAAAVLPVAFILVGLVFWQSRVENRLLKDFLGELKPGFKRADVASVIPKQYLNREDEVTNVLWLTVLAPPDAKAKTCMYFDRDPPWWLGASESAYLYFDANDRLIGIRYVSHRYRFSPSREWGKEGKK